MPQEAASRERSSRGVRSISLTEGAMANTWQGNFPWQNVLLDGYEGTSPVGAFPANGCGLHDMAGNVWEWTADWYVPRHADEVVKPCCGPSVNPRIVSPEKSYDPAQPQFRIPRKVVKRRVVSLRSQLLSALPPSGAPAADDRYRNEPHWLSVHRPVRTNLG